MLTYIWAEAQNGVIGNHGQIPWKHQKADMHHFVQYTYHHIILSGKTTFDSYHMPHGLPHRKNIVLSKHTKHLASGVLLMHDLPSFLNYAKKHAHDEIIVCGGTQVYKELLPYVSMLQRTIIKHNFKGDRKAVPIDYSQFNKIRDDKYPSDVNNQYPYEFQTWLRTKQLDKSKDLVKI